jgi:hypothetical protein
VGVVIEAEKERRKDSPYRARIHGPVRMPANVPIYGAVIQACATTYTVENDAIWASQDVGTSIVHDDSMNLSRSTNVFISQGARDYVHVRS